MQQNLADLDGQCLISIAFHLIKINTCHGRKRPIFRWKIVIYFAATIFFYVKPWQPFKNVNLFIGIPHRSKTRTGGSVHKNDLNNIISNIFDYQYIIHLNICSFYEYCLYIYIQYFVSPHNIHIISKNQFSNIATITKTFIF